MFLLKNNKQAKKGKKEKEKKPAIVAHAFNFSIQEAEAGRFLVSFTTVRDTQ